MDNSRRVSRVESIGDLHSQRQQSLGLQRAFGNAMLQGYALQKLHGYELAVFVMTDFIDRVDVRVVQRGCGTGFPAEPLQSLRVLRSEERRVGKECRS